jgi:hypothetical protein
METIIARLIGVILGAMLAVFVLGCRIIGKESDNDFYEDSQDENAHRRP